MTTPAIPAPIRQWAGMGERLCGWCGGVASGYQWCGWENSIRPNGERSLSRSLINSQARPFLARFPLDQFGWLWRPVRVTRGNGDPMVVYDRLADRWIISQFATPAGAAQPQDECIAVSQTGDATGKWYRYDFHLSFRDARLSQAWRLAGWLLHVRNHVSVLIRQWHSRVSLLCLIGRKCW